MSLMERDRQAMDGTDALIEMAALRDAFLGMSPGEFEACATARECRALIEERARAMRPCKPWAEKTHL